MPATKLNDGSTLRPMQYSGDSNGEAEFETKEKKAKCTRRRSFSISVTQAYRRLRPEFDMVYAKPCLYCYRLS